jgi:hypothetical protein
MVVLLDMDETLCYYSILLNTTLGVSVSNNQ